MLTITCEANSIMDEFDHLKIQLKDIIYYIWIPLSVIIYYIWIPCNQLLNQPLPLDLVEIKSQPHKLPKLTALMAVLDSYLQF
ncbi:hypothetical protein HanRHA438_Chr03g0132501 [Helianthus annuus]|uniref:Uncharacterized protein n=1 Tax=Helianthus annuus TaxID=4232 RepID=A0A251V7W7_HELAN|nr:hypothetical protein HanXRQr2_Chr03g0120601 [Helianthus annuus]KAJ0608745.1 hypothetical protein HanHA89_Chr03g0112441 [Helianthus annuus]KAJ0774534.1 hypothetical protein HanOQP8_Chr03g0113181 [Helianthus annuus]KAJ0936548.1 hypothetical protein HanRHA438_Chr03g0132501 [Helianthus annuus]KAJ0944469.1 hypothetical protein HanPSC8_Chr03g0117121 [Helianthus annuus]